MSFYENEQKAHGDGRPPQSLSADSSDVRRRSAAEPLPRQPMASAPPSNTEAWRQERRPSPAEAAGEQGRGVEHDCSSAQQHSRGDVLMEGEKAVSKHTPQAAGSAAEAEAAGVKRQNVAAPAGGASGHSAAAQTMIAAVGDLATEQGLQSAAKASGTLAQEADLQSVSPTAQPSDTGQLAGPNRKVIQAQGPDDKNAGGAASKAKEGKAAAIHDAAASYAAASKAHSSMQEPLSPKAEPAVPSAVQEHASMKDKVEAVKAEAVIAASAAVITPVAVQQQHSAAAQDKAALQGNAEPASASRAKGADGQQRSEPLQDAAAGSAAPSVHAGTARRHPCLIVMTKSPVDKHDTQNLQVRLLLCKRIMGMYNGMATHQSLPPLTLFNAAGRSQKAVEASAQRKEGSQAKPKSKQDVEQPGTIAAERKQKAKAKDHPTDWSMPSKGPKSKHQKAWQKLPESEKRIQEEPRATDGSMPSEKARMKLQRQERQKAQQENPESRKVSLKEATARPTSLFKQPSQTQLLKLKAEQQGADAEDGRLDLGQQDIEAAHLDAASVSQIKKATAQALAAPDVERHVTMSSEERIRAWQAQQEDAQRDAAAPAQPAEGHAGSSSAAAVAGEASRQKGSDASSLEHSPGMPLKEQLQQPGQSGNELAVAAAAAQHVKQGEGTWLSLSPDAFLPSQVY